MRCKVDHSMMFLIAMIFLCWHLLLILSFNQCTFLIRWHEGNNAGLKGTAASTSVFVFSSESLKIHCAKRALLSKLLFVKTDLNVSPGRYIL